MLDVAREAGVSTATVSHVLNGTRQVSVKTRGRVGDAVTRIGYTPNGVARALRTASTDSVGLVISDVANPYYADVIKGIEAMVGQSGRRLLLANADDDAERELQVVRALVQRRVDGLIVATTSSAGDGAVGYLESRDLPVVLIDRLIGSGFDQVGASNEEPMRALVAHLAELGHERIGIVAGVTGISTTEERLAGYRRALAGAGLEYDDALVCAGRSRVRPAADAVAELMALRRPPTALVAGNNLMAIGVLGALRDLGRVVPGDVALVAFDDFEWSELLASPLTTVAQPGRAIGEEAVRLLLRRIADPRTPPETLRLDPEVIHRRSCGCPFDAPRIAVR